MLNDTEFVTVMVHYFIEYSTFHFKILHTFMENVGIIGQKVGQFMALKADGLGRPVEIHFDATERYSTC